MRDGAGVHRHRDKALAHRLAHVERDCTGPTQTLRDAMNDKMHSRRPGSAYSRTCRPLTSASGGHALRGPLREHSTGGST